LPNDPPSSNAWARPSEIVASRLRGRRAKRWFAQWGKRETLVGYAFVSPWLIGMSAFYLGPMIASAIYSLTSYPIIARPHWIGFRNYSDIASDTQFFAALKVTTIYTAGAVAVYLLGALGLALLCNRRLPGVGVVRTLVFIPSLIPVFAMAILWGWMFNKDFGIVNYVFEHLGLPPQGWFQSESQALWMCIAASFWAIGSAFVVFLAGLQSIPQHLYEAITVDGAGPFRRFWHVTLPMLSPVILFNFVIGIILSFQVFDIGWALTNGGPGNATLFYVLYIWRKAFQEFQMGYASALAWLLFMIIVTVTALIFRTARYWVHYESQA
jgi:multiple sugar transport system permease protein